MAGTKDGSMGKQTPSTGVPVQQKVLKHGESDKKCVGVRTGSPRKGHPLLGDLYLGYKQGKILPNDIIYFTPLHIYHYKGAASASRSNIQYTQTSQLHLQPQALNQRDKDWQDPGRVSDFKELNNGHVAIIIQKYGINALNEVWM